MANQKQITSTILNTPAFTGPVKVGSAELDQLISAIASDAEERRKNGSDERPYYAIDLIRKLKLGALRLPVESGGGGASIRDLFYVLIRLAEADPDVAHSLRSHFSQVEEFLRSPDSEQREQWLQRIANGDIIGNAFTEISSKNVGKYEFETTLSPDGDGYRLNGTKYFSTGAMYSDWVLVMASTAEGKTVAVVLPSNREGIVMQDDWDGIGQKLTGSGTTYLNNVVVYEEEITVIDKTETPFNSILQLFLHGVIAGILRNVVTDASTLVQNRKRTFTFAAADKPVNDPQLQQIIGQLSSIAFAAEAIVLSAADALDDAVNSAIDGNIDYLLSHEASLRTAQAKVVIDDLALRASSLLFEVGGASATRESAKLDRHWRNVRTIASHNPTVYKARAIGNYVVNGVDLPIREIYF